MGIEPTAQAWEAWVLPLYDARYALDSSRVPRGRQIARIVAGAVLGRVTNRKPRREAGVLHIRLGIDSG